MKLSTNSELIVFGQHSRAASALYCRLQTCTVYMPIPYEYYAFTADGASGVRLTHLLIIIYSVCFIDAIPYLLC